MNRRAKLVFRFMGARAETVCGNVVCALGGQGKTGRTRGLCELLKATSLEHSSTAEKNTCRVHPSICTDKNVPIQVPSSRTEPVKSLFSVPSPIGSQQSQKKMASFGINLCAVYEHHVGPWSYNMQVVCLDVPGFMWLHSYSKKANLSTFK